LAGISSPPYSCPRPAFNKRLYIYVVGASLQFPTTSGFLTSLPMLFQLSSALRNDLTKSNILTSHILSIFFSKPNVPYTVGWLLKMRFQQRMTHLVWREE
jgi:hypothetical protein